MKQAYSFRRIISDDMEFLYGLYASTRLDIQSLVDWSAEQKEQFLRMQFDAQHRYYQAIFATAEFNLILSARGKPIGRLYVDDRPDEIRIIDISLRPEHRRHGIGSDIIRNIIDRARLQSLPVRLHVARFNPALKWYTRTGFRVIGETEMTFHMEWSAELTTTQHIVEGGGFRV